MPNPPLADSTPFIGAVGIDTPMAAPVSPPTGQTMQAAGTPAHSPPSGPVPLPIPTSGEGNAAMPQQVIKFNGYGEFSGLLYHSPHSVLYQEKVFPTVLHLFEAHKFLDHRPDLAERIRECERVKEVTAISTELVEFVRRDWDNVALSTMDEVLYLKFSQYGDLRSLLLNTYPAELIYAKLVDPFWGDGAGVGMNELSKSLMRVRERLRVEGDMQARTPATSSSSRPVAMPSPSLGEGTAMPQVIKFSYGEFYGFLDFSPHTVLYQGDLYQTALHLFEARKFLDHRPDLAERIRDCQAINHVPLASAELDEFIRRDWPNIAPSTMDEVLHLKFSQHNHLRSLLLNTYPAELIYKMSYDDPLKRDEAGVGMNELSKSLMRVRERLREEGDMQAGTPTPSPSSGPMPTSQVIKFNANCKFYGFLDFSPHTVLYQGDLYPTASHLFEARKFLDHRPDLAKRIRECEGVEEVTAELAEFTRRDRGRVAFSIMDEVMYLKFGQHDDLCSLLLDTRPAELVHVDSEDPFWGDGAGVGLNELGMSLMRVRERLWTEGGPMYVLICEFE